MSAHTGKTIRLKLSSMEGSYGSEYLKRNARLCAELGADIVKVNWPGY